ncbi:type I-D CRISPR-associated helicase Cas3' [Alkalinema sp. FACHB-956]|uniref:type I-D CRISPR-associated helicase Cas3' n=1 Tax=Alkalinema sp. FACHB-956 TaxID=2692768 RepID=UPI00168755F6|nr:type I-D CRISPR-associated helicase Cas3' [Alkalinema sp. FACHB-956]MBD2329206.1 type I-D CRISPR-associated helicase Cas3' [Alkalinema sp. FACHB-956]
MSHANAFSPYAVQLKPVYSCPAGAMPENLILPNGWTLSWHQLETLKALRDPNVDVVFHAGMTGDGKSLAAQLPVLQGDMCAIALYPTNELVRDQESQTQHYIEKFRPPNEPRVTRLSGALLEIYAENEGISKFAAISTKAAQSEVLLTNPDIFHYLHRKAYLTKEDAPDKLYGRLDKDFDLFIGDEFHVYAVPQIVGLINTLLLIKATNRRKKFLLLSATPDDQLIKRLETAGFRCRVIDPLKEGKYQFPDTPAAQTALQMQGWRQIARSIDLEFVSLEPVAKASETWLKDQAMQILHHFQAHPGCKGAVILNSIASVKRLVPFFQAIFQPQGLTVGENTGLSAQSTRDASLTADLVFGTSTIDVGVDFKINFLIFESSDAGNFIQRLGRLGRHDTNTQGQPFDGFWAYALVPNFVVERLFLGGKPPLVGGERYDRPTLNGVIKENYRQLNDFRGYYKRWGAVQSLSIGMDLGHKTIQQQYAGSRQVFLSACEQVFETSIRQVHHKVGELAKEWQEGFGQKGWGPIAEDACSFRGSSPLLCGIYDETEPNEAERFKTYDLPGILSNLEIELWTEAAFLRSLEATAKRSGQPIPKGRYQYCLAFMRLKAYREERSNWKFHFPGLLETVANAYRVQILTGLEVWQPENRWAAEINKRLRTQATVSYILPRPVAEVRQRLRLPMHFQIYPIGDHSSFQEPTPPYSIAFGQSALLLETLTGCFKSKGYEIWIAG